LLLLSTISIALQIDIKFEICAFALDFTQVFSLERRYGYIYH